MGSGRQERRTLFKKRIKSHYTVGNESGVLLPTQSSVINSMYSTLRLHYNAVSTWLPNIYFQYTVCEDVSSIHNASCENRTPCVFPSQV